MNRLYKNSYKFNEDTAWYKKFSNAQLNLFGFYLLGVIPLIRNLEYFEIPTNTSILYSLTLVM